ncbi:MAG: LytTR family DNA-binding domain-containing protein [Bacteroidota bacterium]
MIKSLIREKKELHTTILVYQGEEIIPISSNNIALVGLEDGKVYLQSLNGKHYHVNQNIEQLAAILGSNFYRLNRQFIINRQCVDRVSYHFDRKLIAHPTFVFKEKLFVSKAKSREFLTWLESN